MTAHLRGAVDDYCDCQSIQIMNKDFSDLSYKGMQVFLSGEATQGVDDGADLPRKINFMLDHTI